MVLLRSSLWFTLFVLPLIPAFGASEQLRASTRSQRDGEPAPAAVQAGEDMWGAEKLVFLLQYIGVDYGAAVENGKIIDPFEFNEMLSFSTQLIEECELLRRHGASAQVRTELERLKDMITRLQPWEDVRDLGGRIAQRLFTELDVVSLPAALPDPERGAQIYQESCATCHGITGAGDGPTPPTSGPSPRSFREDWMRLTSPHHVFNAVSFGIDGTGMASFRDALSSGERWDVSFFVKMLRDDPAPRALRSETALSLRELSLHTDEGLVRLLQARGAPDASEAAVAFYRRNPPSPGLAPDAPASAASTVAKESVAPDREDDPGLDIALRLQDAFARVAERVRPSVVGIAVYVRDETWTPERAESEGGGWTESSPEERLYPGFRRIRAGSGFVVTNDGYVLSCHSVVAGIDGERADVIDIELATGEHVLSRLVGIEPTLNLAVLKLGAFPELEVADVPAVAFGDSDQVQVGHWTIALGDPLGAEQTYAVGTLAARAQRQCYQEELSRTLLQSSISIHPESHGGPLVNIRGEVVGINLPRPTLSSLVEAGPHGMAFSLPANLATGIFEALRLTESKQSPWLGFSVLELATIRRRLQRSGETVSLPPTGVYIDDLFAPSPASEAGVRVGDILSKLDGHRLFSPLDFQRWLYLSGIGREVTLELVRAGETLRLRVAIEERPLSIPTT